MPWSVPVVACRAVPGGWWVKVVVAALRSRACDSEVLAMAASQPGGEIHTEASQRDCIKRRGGERQGAGEDADDVIEGSEALD